ncbi:tricorn protease [Stackebrandtia albiflava]|uniref:Tricorn protease homolog n=1 Tax=Stackebrandtia albiflava TaxID=406432 RepID=A0A562UQJ7_9ACTN|nr:S41 family peptidase [Stackebrandtia albiflava]TWJ07876.1 tricorn protease [Stackebrandtia albiflava]
MTTGYPRFPTIHGDTIVFVAEDDLWRVPADGGTAHRLTAGLAAASDPRISPDGRHVAYTGAEEGPAEVYLAPSEGGEGRRLTYEAGGSCKVVGWTPDGSHVLYASSITSPTRVESRLRKVAATGGDSVELPLGRAGSISFGPGGARVIGREYWRDFAHWKRYRGGTAGQLWLDANGDGDFRKLIKLDGNLTSPQLIGDRVYFLSDHEGYGNVYSCDYSGGDLRRHTDHDDFYARSLSGDGSRMVYHCGGALYLLDPAEDGPRRLDVYTPVTRTQRARKFVDASSYLHSVKPSPEGGRLAVTSRGKAFSFANWEGPVIQHGDTDGTRYRLLTWLHGGRRLVAVAGDTSPEETLAELSADESEPQRRHPQLDLGRAVQLVASPTEARIAVANHRNQLLLVDLDGEEPRLTVLDTARYGRISDPVFSPDGKWLAYACPEIPSEIDSAPANGIRLVELATGEITSAAERVLSDSSPAFDPDGRFLYFIGHREFNPVYDSLHFDLGFPTGSRPYAVSLRADTPVPFVPQPAPLVESGDDKPAEDKASEDKPADADSGEEAAPEATEAPDPDAFRIDREGLRDRVVPLPVPDGVYQRVLGVSGKVLVLSEPVAGTIPSHESDDSSQGVIETVDLATGKVERYADGVSAMALSADGKALLYLTDDQVRVVKATEKAPDGGDFNRESGWVDLSRIKVSVRPELEWPQMFREAWRLLAQQFWTEDMSGVDWNAVYDRYAPMVDQVSTRAELSDLIWEMNGELGTSHVYETPGDPRRGPHYGQGYLGADFSVDEEGRYRIDRILRGDVWRPDATSPLNRPGVDVREGDLVLAVNGQPVGEAGRAPATVGQRLVNQAGEEVRLTVRRGDGPPRQVVVKALVDEQALRYRAWVDANRAAVHAATGGRIGYVHIPDMGPHGYAEFHRGFLNEYDRQGLLIDVRNNGGGHVSSLLIEKLARRRHAYDFSRWDAPTPHPVESPRGPMVALTNELAGSDGDIFSHSFRLLGLGPLVGTRTWGGVIGYTGRPGLSDNTFLSQPEFAFHFDDAKWGVENYGVQPDVEVEYPPQAYAAGEDPQLAKAVEVALQELERRPGHRPDPSDRPRLSAPPLPPRPQDRS